MFRSGVHNRSGECMLIHLILVAPTRPPHDVTPSTTSRSVSVSWSTIECIERNGEITNYTLVFQEQGGAVIPGEVNAMDRTFTASGLTPHTNYTFRVAGINSNGTGPYTNISGILTEEDGTLYLRNAKALVCINGGASAASGATLS